MKILLETWRYGVVSEIEYHGSAGVYCVNDAVIMIADPILSDGRVGLAQVVTVTSGDSVFTLDCGCADHKQFAEDSSIFQVAQLQP